MPRDETTLLDILNAARLIQQFVVGMDQEAFASDEKTQSATLHQLSILGEAVKRLSNEFRDAHDDLPWKMMAGMRDKLIHDYDSVDLSQVWQTIARDVPQVISVLEPLAPKNDTT